jgi:hypothetical protein
MKLSLFPLVLALGFISVSVFGFFAMGHAADHGNCIAATLNGRVCSETDVFGTAAYHLSAFHKAARAVSADAGAVSAFFSFVAALFLAAISGPLKNSDFRAKIARGVEMMGFRPRQIISLWRWLSFHENSPNVFYAR